jgi:hypothetical protein
MYRLWVFSPLVLVSHSLTFEMACPRRIDEKERTIEARRDPHNLGPERCVCCNVSYHRMQYPLFSVYFHCLIRKKTGMRLQSDLQLCKYNVLHFT